MGILFEFDEKHFNKLFPFYLLMDKNFTVVSVGESLKKISPTILQQNFSANFILKRPHFEITQFIDFQKLIDQLVVLESVQNSELLLRGQFDFIQNNELCLFVGTPWLGSMDQVSRFNLTINNFAVHDPLIELLHVQKNQEISNDEIKQLLNKVNDQKNKLKLSENKYRNIVEQASDIIYKYSLKGHYTFVNETAQRITGYSKEELYKMNYLELIREDYKEEVAKFYINQVKNNIPTSYFEFPILAKNGNEIWIGQSVQFPLNDAEDAELTALAINITQRKTAELNLSLQEEKYRNIIANMNLGLLEVDNDDCIQFANQSFCAISGYSIDELIGKKAADLLLDENTRQMLKEKNNIRKEGVSDMYTVPFINKYGEKRWWVISGAPRYNDGGELVGSVGIHLDITEQKLLEKELEIAKEKAEESSLAKETFLATMSHEIRTPLNAIVGIANMMQMNPTLRTNENVDILSFSSKNLLSLITDILDFSKIEAGKIELSKNKVYLHELLKSIYQTFNILCEEKGITLKLNIQHDLPHVIIGDELRLSQILNNLISNAIKFTMEGFVEIIVESEPFDANKSKLIFKIKDTGIGIQENKLDTVFMAFEQADKSITNKFGGTGLGLNITKKLIEMHGGTIQLTSEINKGSEFRFCIDFEILKESNPLKTNSIDSANVPSNSLLNKTVLLVEDNLINQKVAMSFLKLWGLNTSIANNGKEAIDMLNKMPYDVVIMDLYMPVMDGFEAITAIRNNPSPLIKDTPIIALTASAEITIINKSFDLGANLCLLKPFNPKQLYDGLVETLAKLETSSKASTNTETITPLNEKFEYINLRLLDEASLNSKSFVFEILNDIAEEVSTLINRAKSELNNKQFESFSKSIHKLKNSLLILGVAVLKDDLNYMEAFQLENLEEIEHKFLSLEKIWALANVEINRAKQLYIE